MVPEFRPHRKKGCARKFYQTPRYLQNHLRNGSCYPAQRNLVERFIEKVPSGIQAVYGNPHVQALERLVEHQIAGGRGERVPASEQPGRVYLTIYVKSIIAFFEFNLDWANREILQRINIGPCTPPQRCRKSGFMVSTHSRCLSPTSCAIHEELACDGAAKVETFCVTDPCVKPRSSVSSLRHMSNVLAGV